MTKHESEKRVRKDKWYLSIMAPNTKGDSFAWLDPTSIYINSDAFHDLVNDLLRDLVDVEVDVVGGIDAMGFVLGAALATRLGVGCLPFRKAGKLCVETDAVSFVNYSGRIQDMEMRKPAFQAGTRVMLVDQWIETGGTMTGAIELIKRQGGIVSGIVALAIEENDTTNALRNDYLCVSAVKPGTPWQAQCNAQHLDSFTAYSPALAFPKSSEIK